VSPECFPPPTSVGGSLMSLPTTSVEQHASPAANINPHCTNATASLDSWNCTFLNRPCARGTTVATPNRGHDRAPLKHKSELDSWQQQADHSGFMMSAASCVRIFAACCWPHGNSLRSMLRASQMAATTVNTPQSNAFPCIGDEIKSASPEWLDTHPWLLRFSDISHIFKFAIH
jgi:hypothetical protein